MTKKMIFEGVDIFTHFFTRTHPDEEGFDHCGRWWPVKDTEEERDLTMLGE